MLVHLWRPALQKLHPIQAPVSAYREKLPPDTCGLNAAALFTCDETSSLPHIADAFLAAFATPPAAKADRREEPKEKPHTRGDHGEQQMQYVIRGRSPNGQAPFAVRAISRSRFSRHISELSPEPGGPSAVDLRWPARPLAMPARRYVVLRIGGAVSDEYNSRISCHCTAITNSSLPSLAAFRRVAQRPTVCLDALEPHHFAEFACALRGDARKPLRAGSTRGHRRKAQCDPRPEAYRSRRGPRDRPLRRLAIP